MSCKRLSFADSAIFILIRKEHTQHGVSNKGELGKLPSNSAKKSALPKKKRTLLNVAFVRILPFCGNISDVGT
jgi:hypothetical protein